MVCVSVRISGVIHFWTARVIKEKSTVIIPMQTAALWFSFICYRCLSESMSSPAPRLAARLYLYPEPRLPFLPGRSLHLLSRRQNQRCSHIVKDWLYGFFCLYKQFSDPCQKKWICNYRRETGRKAPEGCECRKCFCSLWGWAVLFSYQQWLR